MNFTRTALLLAVLTAIFVSLGALLGGYGGMLIAFVLALGMNMWSLYKSDKMVLRMHQAQEVDAQSGGQYYEIVRTLAERAGLPMPRVYVMQNPQPNAFATGRNPENSAVCASTGLLEMLSAEEVAGVMAHELAHIKNRDTLTMTVAASIGGAITLVAQSLQFGAIFGRGQRTNWLTLILGAIVAPFAAMLVQMAISRSREYQADRLGAMIAGEPRWLASALVRIHEAARRTHNDTAERFPATAHMFIVNPLTGRGIDNLFSTHPNVENRIAELQKLEQELAASRTAGPSISGATPWLRHTASTPRRGPWG
jgi:heat shock protein HtpX